MKRQLKCLIVAAALAVSACGGNSLTGPDNHDLSGTWIGNDGYGEIRTNLNHTGATLSGTWTAVYAGSGGNLTGTVAGTALSITLMPSVPTRCPFSVTASVVNKTTIQGTYATMNCTIYSSGSLTLTKR